MQIAILTGDEMHAVLPALAALRIRVFREWPYLYEGSLEYEQKYLEKFGSAKDAIIVVARDGDTIVGASTASPLLGHADAFAIPFAEKGYAPERVFYFGESILLSEYRGRGIGVAFFEAREAHARSLGAYEIATFCAVIRDESDARKPKAYVPLDAFWGKRGFAKEPGLKAQFDWKEPGQDKHILHDMQFWIKKL